MTFLQEFLRWLGGWWYIIHLSQVDLFFQWKINFSFIQNTSELYKKFPDALMVKFFWMFIEKREKVDSPLFVTQSLSKAAIFGSWFIPQTSVGIWQ